MKTVYIIEDQRILLDLLSQLVRKHPALELLGRTDNGRVALKELESLEPEVVLLDIGLPGINGLELLKRLKKKTPTVFVLVFTSHDEGKVVRAALRGGADSFLDKNVPLEELEEALDRASRGQSFFTAAAMQGMRDLVAEPHMDSPLDILTPREKEVLQLIAESHTNKEICSILNLSLGTVNTHRWNLMRKLNIHDAAALTRFAIENGITPSGTELL